MNAMDEVQVEMQRLNSELDQKLRIFGDFEISISQRLKEAATAEEETALFAELAAYESALEVDVLVERIEHLRQILLARQQAPAA